MSGTLDIMFVSWGCKGDRNSTVERAPQPRTSQHKRTAALPALPQCHVAHSTASHWTCLYSRPTFPDWFACHSG